MLTTIPGEYDNGLIRLSGVPPAVRRSRVLVTFLEEGQEPIAPGVRPAAAEALAALDTVTLDDEEATVLDEFESFRENHPLDLRSLPEDAE